MSLPGYTQPDVTKWLVNSSKDGKCIGRELCTSEDGHERQGESGCIFWRDLQRKGISDISYHGCHHTHLPGRNHHCQRQPQSTSRNVCTRHSQSGKCQTRAGT